MARKERWPEDIRSTRRSRFSAWSKASPKNNDLAALIVWLPICAVIVFLAWLIHA
jgi:hypothetical protein